MESMSETTPPPVDHEAKSSAWGTPAVAIYALSIFVVALIIAYVKGSENLLTILLGVAAANATTAVNFYLGSSSGSNRKDLIIHDAQRALANSTPMLPAPK